jgi:hypothetical protein
MNRYARRSLIGVLAGGAVGFVIGYFGRCPTGTCVFTSDPVTSTVLGALIGGLLGFLN